MKIFNKIKSSKPWLNGLELFLVLPKLINSFAKVKDK